MEGSIRHLAEHARSATLDPDEREQARRRIAEMALDEFKRVLIAINLDGALGNVQLPLALRLGKYGQGPELVIDEEDVGGLLLGQLQDLIGQNLDIELKDGRLTIFCPSWPPDRIPF